MKQKKQVTSSRRKDVSTTPTIRRSRRQAPSLLTGSPAAVGAQARHEMISCVAYDRAEKRGFAGGAASQLEDWLEAEAQVDRMLSERRSPGAVDSLDGETGKKGQP